MARKKDLLSISNIITPISLKFAKEKKKDIPSITLPKCEHAFFEKKEKKRKGKEFGRKRGLGGQWLVFKEL